MLKVSLPKVQRNGQPQPGRGFPPVRPWCRACNQGLSGAAHIPLIRRRTGGRLAKCASQGRNLRPILTVGAASEPEGTIPSDWVRAIGSRNRPARHRYPWRSEGRADEGDEGTTRGDVGGAGEICGRRVRAVAGSDAAHPAGRLPVRSGTAEGTPVSPHARRRQRVRRLLSAAGALDLFHYRS